MLALLVFFRKRIWGILKDVFVNRRYKLAINILITSVPAAFLGFFLASFIESNFFFTSVVVVVVTLAVVGVVMILLEKLPRASAVSDGEKLPAWRALVVGAAQAIALIPGVSRSGSTIIAGRLMGTQPSQSGRI